MALLMGLDYDANGIYVRSYGLDHEFASPSRRSIKISDA